MKSRLIHLFFVALTATMIILMSCKKGGNESPTLFIMPYVTDVVFSADGLSLFSEGATISSDFTVITNQKEWNAMSDKMWVQATPLTDNRFSLSVALDASDSPPEPAKVYITAGAATPFVFGVTQASPDPPDPPDPPTDEIPRVGSLNRETMQHTVERYLEMKEAGITHGYCWFYTANAMNYALSVAAQAGVKMIARCPELFDTPEIVADKFKDHSGLAGYCISDEPHRNDFPQLAALARRIEAVDHKHFCFVNLFPNYAGLGALGTSSYREHVQLFINEVRLPIVSFDHYPIQKNSSGVRTIRSDWYDNLEIISDEARKAGKPFWAYVCSIAIGNSFFSAPVPTLDDLRLQVYSNLVYGAQGILYFTYWSRPGSSDDLYGSPIGDDGEKTETWYLVKQVNEEIKNLSGVFYDAEVLKVEHHVRRLIGNFESNGTLPSGTTRFDFANRPGSAKSAITSFSTSGACNLVVSFLQKGNRSYMVVLNRNLPGSANSDLANITIETAAGVRRIHKDGTSEPASNFTGNQTLAPCDMWIYGWDN